MNAELKMKLNAWAVKANERGNHFVARKEELGLKAYEYRMKISKSFITSAVQTLSPEEAELSDESAKRLDELYDFEKLRKLPAYSPLNTLAVLRIYYRKLRQLDRDFYREREPLQQLLKELKTIDKASKGYFESTITTFREMTQDLLEEKLDGYDFDYWLFVEGLFYKGRTLKRDDFLQLITLDKHVTAEIPEEIDERTFHDLIVVERIEADGDSYLFNIWVEHFFRMKEEYEKQTGEEVFNVPEVLEEITGKPLQTFTAEFDEYGDVIHVTPNKPNLRLVEKPK